MRIAMIARSILGTASTVATTKYPILKGEADMGVTKYIVEEVNLNTGKRSEYEYDTYEEAQGAYQDLAFRDDVTVTLRKSSKKLLSEA